MQTNESDITWTSSSGKRSAIYFQVGNEGRLVYTAFKWVENPKANNEPVRINLCALQRQVDIVNGVRYLVHDFSGAGRKVSFLCNPDWKTPYAFIDGLRVLKGIVQRQLEERVRFYRDDKDGGDESAADEMEAVLKCFNEHFEALLRAYTLNAELDGFDRATWEAAFQTV